VSPLGLEDVFIKNHRYVCRVSDSKIKNGNEYIAASSGCSGISVFPVITFYKEEYRQRLYQYYFLQEIN
jgi:hypothetical protein